MFPCRIATATAVASLLVSGCGESAREVAAAGAAEAFGAAVVAGNGPAACAMLTERARQSVESFGRSCPQVIVTLPHAGAAADTEVWSSGAQVRFEHDVVFLARFDDGWKVRAAGCRPRPDEPYDCMLAD